MSANVMLEEQRQLQDAQPEWSDMVGWTLPNIGRKAGVSEHKDNDTKTIKREAIQTTNATNMKVNQRDDNNHIDRNTTTHSTENMELQPMSMNSHKISNKECTIVALWNNHDKVAFVLV